MPPPKKFLGALFCLLMIFCNIPVNAQEEHPLLVMLGRVPNVPTTRTDIYYVDWRAIEVAYPPALKPPNYAAFNSIGRDIPGIQLWWLTFRNASSQIAQYAFDVGEEMPSVVGFDLFQIERELAYGRPPANTLQLEGSFELATIRNAFSALGFVQEARDDAELWCSQAGCDQGYRTDIIERQTANPFGGDIGRKQPLLIGDNVLISSADNALIELHILAANGHTLTLADVPQYRAVIDNAVARGTVIQAYFVDGEFLAQLQTTPIDPLQNLSETNPEAPSTERESLPVYQMILMVDIVSETEQIGFFGLVYSDEADAYKAAELLPQRIANYNSNVVERPMSALLASRYITVRTDVSQHEETGLWITALEWVSPKATTEEIFTLTDLSNSDTATIEKSAPGLVYRLMIQMLFRRDTGWLSVD